MSSSGTTFPQQLVAAPVAARVVLWPRILLIYAFMHGLWFALYAFFGKGFAYAGWPPFYVGEFLLGFALIALLATRRLGSLILTPVGGILSCFMLWQLACMLPYLETFGFDALRDSVIWGYGVFAWIAAAMVLRLPGLLSSVVANYKRFSRVYLVLGPCSLLATLYFRDWLPIWPNTDVSIPLLKGGEFCVHLAGIFAFVAMGLTKIPQWWLSVILAEALLGMNVRGGLLAFLGAVVFVLVFRPRLERLLLIVVSSLLLLTALAAFDLRISVPGSTKEFSFGHLSNSLISMVADSDQSSLENTKRWRLMWWKKIWDYTVEGSYFWTGKGYGINLADSDGFQVTDREEPLRSPHSSHLTFLARSGVPGFVLWIVLQMTWAGSILLSFFRARRIGTTMWSGLFAWILAYWFAFVVSAGFDVFFEGPMAGIPFWTVFGLGWGSHILFRNQLKRAL